MASADLLAEAHRRTQDHPGTYFEDRVYGEVEAGGTQCLVLSQVDFSKLGLPALGKDTGYCAVRRM